MLDDELFRGNDVSEFVEILASIEHDAGHHTSKYHERHLVGDAVVTGNKEQGTADDERHPLRDDILRPVRA